MRILLTNRSLTRREGSEVWTLTMYNELVKNHDVSVFTRFGNSLLKDVPEFNNSEYYDLAIVNHNECLKVLAGKPNIGTIVFTCHGVIPEPEKPISGADFYVGVSEETKGSICQEGFKCAKIIRNPIDTELYKKTKPINKKLKNVLFISNRDNATDFVKKACYGLNFTKIGGAKSVDNLQDYINDNDLVVTLGRGIYEAMACERNVVIFDNVAGDGFVTNENVYKFRENNCSGRYKKMRFSIGDLMQEIKRYDYTLSHRKYILKNHDVKNIANQYLSFGTKI